MKIGVVYHQQFADGERHYFKPTAQLKNGGWKGTILDGGAAGRSKRKTKTTSVHWCDLWTETPQGEIPEQLS